MSRGSKLVRSHYRRRCQIDDDKQRAALTAQAEKRGWTADVFLEPKSGETLFINNALLENGHAVRMDGDAPHDWVL